MQNHGFGFDSSTSFDLGVGFSSTIGSASTSPENGAEGPISRFTDFFANSTSVRLSAVFGPTNYTGSKSEAVSWPALFDLGLCADALIAPAGTSYNRSPASAMMVCQPRRQPHINSVTYAAMP